MADQYRSKHSGQEIDEAVDAIPNLQPKEDGKGLSTNDYTDEEKEKLEELENYDDTAIKERLTTIEEKETGWNAKAELSDITKERVGLDNVDNTSDEDKKTNFTGSIASGNTGFVTGGDVYIAIGDIETALATLTTGSGV